MEGGGPERQRGAVTWQRGGREMRRWEQREEGGEGSNPETTRGSGHVPGQGCGMQAQSSRPNLKITWMGLSLSFIF